MTDWSDGGPMQWGISDSDTDPGEPSGYKAIVAPHFRLETFFADFEKWVRNLYRCNNWQKCLHADLLDGYHAAGLLSAAAAALEINGLTAATPASGDEFIFGDISDSNLTKKVTLANLIAAMLTAGIDHGGLSGLGDDDHTQYVKAPDPASSTDNAVARWDGTDGRTIQTSGVTIDDSDNMAVPGSLTATTVELGGSGVTDTTLSRSDAGVVAVEGDPLLRSSQDLSDVSSNTTALTNLGVPRVIRSSGLDVASTTLASSGMAPTLETGWYDFEAYLLVSCATDGDPDGGFKFDIGDGTATIGNLSYVPSVVTATGTAGENILSARVTSKTTVVTVVSSGGFTTQVVKIIGSLQCTVAGTFGLRHAMANGTATGGKGDTGARMETLSWLRLTKHP